MFKMGRHWLWVVGISFACAISARNGDSADDSETLWHGEEQTFENLVGAAADLPAYPLLRACLGSARIPDEQAAQAWRRVHTRGNNIDRAEHIPTWYIPLPRPIAGSAVPVLWMAEPRVYCLLDLGGEPWKLLSRLEDVTPPIVSDLDGETGYLNNPGLLRDEEGWWVEMSYEWERAASGWRLVRHKNGWRYGDWRAETLEISADLGRIVRIGPRWGGFSAFEEIFATESADGRVCFTFGGESLAAGHYCWLFSQGGGLERYEHQREIIREELRLGRRISDNEAYHLIGDEANACATDKPEREPPKSPPTCLRFTETGTEWILEAVDPVDASAKAAGRPDPQSAPRIIPSILERNLLRGLGEDARFEAINSDAIPGADRAVCLGEPGARADGYLPVPFALPMADLPTLSLTPTALCLFASPREGQVRRYDRLNISPPLSALRWVGWVPGSTVRYRYFVLAGSAIRFDTGNDLRLYRLDLATAGVKFLHRFSGQGEWWADMDADAFTIINFDPRELPDAARRCFHQGCDPSDAACRQGCASAMTPGRRTLIIDHGKLVSVPFIAKIRKASS